MDMTKHTRAPTPHSFASSPSEALAAVHHKAILGIGFWDVSGGSLEILLSAMEYLQVCFCTETKVEGG